MKISKRMVLSSIVCVLPLVVSALLYQYLRESNSMNENEWVRCPICGNKTRDRIRVDTILVNYPLYCPKCKQETLISVRQLKTTVIKEPDAQTQSR